MVSAEHVARRVAAHQRAEETHRRAGATHERAARLARRFGNLERAQREDSLARQQVECAGLECQRAEAAAPNEATG